MGFKPIDDRQIVNRAILQQLFPWVGSQTLDVLMASINAEVTPPLSVTATASPSLVVDIGPAIVSNPESDRNHSISFINSEIPSFVSGTVTFPSTSGSNIVASTGGLTLLNLPSGDYVQVVLALDQFGNIIVTVGVPNAVEANALVPAPAANTLPFAYVTLFNSGGTIQNVTQSNIYQLSGSGGSSSSSAPLYIAKQIGLPNGSTSISVSFSTPQPDVSFIILGMMGNLIDTHPQFQQIEVVDKSETGFTFKWNHPLDSANYFISYIIPPKIFPEAEAAIPSGVNTINSVLPIAQNGPTYAVIAQLQNIVDPNPQFQTIVVGTNTNTSVNLDWNVDSDTANYQAVYMVGAGQVAIANSSSSVTVALPVNYGTPNYAIVATVQNIVDSHPQFQPLLITAQSSGSVTFSWNVARDTGNYLLNYYVVSLTS